jgi:hypothetical protein
MRQRRRCVTATAGTAALAPVTVSNRRAGNVDVNDINIDRYTSENTLWRRRLWPVLLLMVHMHVELLRADMGLASIRMAPDRCRSRKHARVSASDRATIMTIRGMRLRN